MNTKHRRSSAGAQQLLIMLACVLSGLGIHAAAAESAKPAQQGHVQQAKPQRSALRLVGTPAGSIFLRGQFIEVGMHTLGSFGAEDYVLFEDGFHPLEDIQSVIDPETEAFTPIAGILGFIVNPDGWSSPSDQPTLAGDFFVPGTPEEVWGVTWNYGVDPENTVRFMNAGLVESGVGSRSVRAVLGAPDDPVQVPVESTYPRDISSGDDHRSVWRGTAVHSALEGQRIVTESLQITQTVHFSTNDQFFVMNVVMTNNGSTTIRGLKYLRSVDPDQEAGVPVQNLAHTLNYVVYQPPRGQLPAFPLGNVDKALVVGKGITNGVPLGLGAIDRRARVSYGGFTNRDPLAVLQLGEDVDGNVLADSARVGTPNNADEAISLAFDLGDVAPGQSVSIDYAYVLSESDLEVALGQLSQVTILQPTGTVSGNSALFQVSTNNPSANTTKVEFYVAGLLVGTDESASRTGVFASVFDTTGLPNGLVTIEAVAFFDDDSISRKSSSVMVDNGGPVISFTTPTPVEESVISGSSIPVAFSFDAQNPPNQIALFLEYDGLSFVQTPLTQPPFFTSIAVPSVAPGTSLVIKAVAGNQSASVTTVSRTFFTPSESDPETPAEVSSPALPLSTGDRTIYTALSPSTSAGISSVIGALTGRPNSVTRAFAWDSSVQRYVEVPASSPTGGIQTWTGIFIATRTPLTYNLSGSATAAPFTLSLRHSGWTFAGIPPVEVNAGTYESTYAWPHTLEEVTGTLIEITIPGGVPIQDAMGTPSGALETSRPWYWNGSEYVQVDQLEAGKGYWFKNNLPSADITLTIPSAVAGSLQARAPSRVDVDRSGPVTVRDQGSPPPPPSGGKQDNASSSSACGVGSGVASFALLLLAFVGFRLLRHGRQ